MYLFAIILLCVGPLITAVTFPNGCMDEFRKSGLDVSNFHRSRHGSPNLSRDPQLEQSALNYANVLAAKGGALVHSTNLNKTSENLYVEYSDGGVFDVKKCKTIAQNCITNWYSEIKAYNFAKPGFSVATGHFTQLIWKSTSRVGFGLAKGVDVSDGTTWDAYYCVAHYQAPGNTMSTKLFQENVPSKA